MFSEIWIGSLNRWVIIIGIGCFGIKFLCSVWNWLGSIILVWLIMFVGLMLVRIVFVLGILFFKIVEDKGLWIEWVMFFSCVVVL